MSQTIPPVSPNGMIDILAHYGDPLIKVVNGKWTVDAKWESANLITVHHGLLPFGKLYVHRLIAQPTLNVLDRWSQRIKDGDTYKLRTMGCFNPRAQRGSSGLVMSMHTLAIAWDVNADKNPLIEHCTLYDPRRTAPGSHDIPDEWFDDIEAEGFFSGKDFGGRYDPQHQQMARGA